MVTQPSLLTELNEARLELNQLHTEVAQLRGIRDAALFQVGPEECIEGGCEDYLTEDGEERPDVVHCTHVKVRYATYGDVYLREHLENLVIDIRDRLTAGQPCAEVLEALQNTLYAGYATEYSPTWATNDPVNPNGREPYATAFAAEAHLAAIPDPSDP